MKTRRLLALAAALLLAIPAVASAQVPGEVPIQGYLTDDTGVPIDGSASVTFTIYDAATGGTQVHTETQSIDADAGAFTAYLMPDLAIFENNTELYLAMSVDGGAEMSPRLKMSTVPFAAVAGNAQALDGQTATDLSQPDWSDIQNKPSDFGTTYTAASPINIDSNDEIGLITTCPSDNVLKWDGSQWACAADENTSYSAGSGVEIDGSNNIGLLSTCASGQVLKWDGTGWACQDDTDTDTTYLAGAGLSLTSNQFEVDYSATQQRVTGTCAAGEYITGVNQDGTVSCATDQDTTYAAGTGLALDSGTNTFSVAADGITSAEIADGTITDADVSGTAAIDPTKISGEAATLNGGADFGGTVTATDFQYSSPRLEYLTVPAASFSPLSSNEDDTWFHSSFGYAYISNDGGDGAAVLTAIAPVDLPEDSTITDVYCYYRDNSSTENLDMTFRLRRQELLTGVSAATETISTGSGTSSGDSTNIFSFSDTGISTNNVVADQDEHWISLTWNPDSATSTLRFYGCKIYHDVVGP